MSDRDKINYLNTRINDIMNTLTPLEQMLSFDKSTLRRLNSLQKASKGLLEETEKLIDSYHFVYKQKKDKSFIHKIELSYFDKDNFETTKILKIMEPLKVDSILCLQKYCIDNSIKEYKYKFIN